MQGMNVVKMFLEFWRILLFVLRARQITSTAANHICKADLNNHCHMQHWTRQNTRIVVKWAGTPNEFTDEDIVFLQPGMHPMKMTML